MVNSGGEARQFPKLTFLIFLLLFILPPAFSPAELYDKSLVCKGCNVVIISLDVLNSRHMGYQGYFRNTTPFLDGFASRSIVFNRTYAPSHTTLVSDVSIFTGALPSAHGVWPDCSSDGCKVRMPSGDLTYLPETFRKNGYSTGAFLSNSFLPEELAEKMGFSEYFRPNETSVNFNETMERAYSWAEARKDSPFFLWIMDYDLHTPYSSDGKDFFASEMAPFPEGFILNWDDALLCSSESGEYKTTFYHEDADEIPVSPASVERVIAQYDGILRESDRKIGEFISRLEGLGISNRTIFIFLSEHGENVGEGNSTCFGHGEFYEEVMQVPLFIGTPSREGAVIDGTYSLIDLPETVRFLSGLGNVKGSLLSGDAGKYAIYQDMRSFSRENPSESVYDTFVRLDTGKTLSAVYVNSRNWEISGFSKKSSSFSEIDSGEARTVPLYAFGRIFRLRCDLPFVGFFFPSGCKAPDSQAMRKAELSEALSAMRKEGLLE